LLGFTQERDVGRNDASVGHAFLGNLALELTPHGSGRPRVVRVVGRPFECVGSGFGSGLGATHLIPCHLGQVEVVELGLFDAYSNVVSLLDAPFDGVLGCGDERLGNHEVLRLSVAANVASRSFGPPAPTSAATGVAISTIYDQGFGSK
jgi:hypothetical protein